MIDAEGDLGHIIQTKDLEEQPDQLKRTMDFEGLPEHEEPSMDVEIEVQKDPIEEVMKDVAVLPFPPYVAYPEGELKLLRAYLQVKCPIRLEGPGENLHLKGPPRDGKKFTLVLGLDKTLVYTIVSEMGYQINAGEVRPLWNSIEAICSRGGTCGRWGISKSDV